MLETALFEEQSGKKTMTILDLFQTIDDHDGALQKGMKEGAAESADRFAQLLQKLRGRLKSKCSNAN